MFAVGFCLCNFLLVTAYYFVQQLGDMNLFSGLFDSVLYLNDVRLSSV